uniref:Ig-like domain-containing protein n=1 Tax=Neogobius melanostomus TaxID=47308 RepID=A0A8C6U994_9GOBI
MSCPCVSLSVLGEEPVVDAQRPQYPALGQNTTLDCDCGGMQCEQVAWFRIFLYSVQMLGLSNQADRVTYGPQLELKVRVSKRSGAGYSLRIFSTTTADRGMYACIIKVRGNDKNSYELVRGGTLLLPGGQYYNKYYYTTWLVLTFLFSTRCPADGCGSLVLWPLVGMASALCVTLVCTLLYYSRDRKNKHGRRWKMLFLFFILTKIQRSH